VVVDTRLLIATRSAGKMRELRDLVAAHGWVPVDLVEAQIDEAPDEAGLEVCDTFAANALAKARYFHARSGVPVLADDSGLEVLALGGAPGVHSKRWSGRTDVEGVALDAVNNALLLERLQGVTDRRARYVCAAAWCGADGERVCLGAVEGVIAHEPEGHGGFGYDPYFRADELDGRTFASVTRAEKARVSHRARAVRALLGAVAGVRVG
jgi:XTP/dITP diphosphohydrolase